MIAVIGDSTFLHMGMQGLLDIVYNRGNVTVLLLDNRAVGMTGGQSNPGSGLDIHGQETPKVDFPKLVESLGVKPERIHEVNPYELPTLFKALRDEVKVNDTSVIITNQPCVLIDEYGAKPPLTVVADKCTGCSNCLAVESLSQTALLQGYDVKKTEVAGMAQRGGVVTSHVRFGPRVLSLAIPPGEADILVGFEPAEALRWSTHLRPGGVAMVNRLRQEPPGVTLGLFDYPDDPVGEMRRLGIEVHAFDAGAIARDLGNLRLVNTVMLGAISDYLPFPAEILKDTILARKPKLVKINEQAFEAGREAQAMA